MRTSLLVLSLVMVLFCPVAVEAQLYRGLYLKQLDEIALDGNPSSIAVDEGRNRIYVGMQGKIVIIDGGTGEKIQEIYMDFDVEVMKLNEANGRLYVGGSGTSNVTVIDPGNGQIVGNIEEGIDDSYCIAIDPITNRIYVTDPTYVQGSYDQVHVYDGDTLVEIATIDIPGSYEPSYVQDVGVAVNPSTNTIFVTWSYGDTVLVYDGSDYNLVMSKGFGLYSFSLRVFVNPSTSHVHIGDQTLDEMLNPIEGVQTVYSYSIQAYIPDMNLLVCSRSYYEGGSIQLLDGDNNEEICSVELNRDVDDLAVNCLTRRAYFIDETYPAVLIVHFGLDARSPSVEMTSPEEDSLLSVDSFKLEWAGSDEDSGIEHYEVRLDEEEWKNVGLERTYTFADVSDGDRVISVRAFDYAGNVDEKAVHIFVDTTPPYIYFVTPAEGETVKTTDATVEWSGWDNYGEIEHFEIRIDNEPWIDKGVSEEHTFTRLAEGTHTLTLKGADLAGHASEVSITFIVNLSLIGGPGWVDDIIVFLAITLAIAAVALVIGKKRRGRAPASREYAFPPSTLVPPPKMVRCATCGRSWIVPARPVGGPKMFISLPRPDLPAGGCPRCGNMYCQGCAPFRPPTFGFYYCPKCDVRLEITPDVESILSSHAG